VVDYVLWVVGANEFDVSIHCPGAADTLVFPEGFEGGESVTGEIFVE
jgi:hypothetical protein